MSISSHYEGSINVEYKGKEADSDTFEVETSSLPEQKSDPGPPCAAKRIDDVDKGPGFKKAEDVSNGNDEDENEEESDSGSDESDESDEALPLEFNHEALRHIATYYVPGGHGKCIGVTILTEGTFHEVKTLSFEDGWTCIGRFTKKQEHLAKSESELATIEYVMKHTAIPVPETYFVNFNANHAVGAPFVLMQRMPGEHLYTMWDDMSTEHKKHVISQIASVLVNLASLKFDKIGSLKTSGTVGPLCVMEDDGPYRGPYASSTEFMLSRMPSPLKEDGQQDSQTSSDINTEIRHLIQSYMRDHGSNPVLSAPYRLIHGDFDAQNMLFIQPDAARPPELSGIIDWDYSRTGMLYELFEYPIFIQDVHWSEQLYEENRILRKHFVQAIAQAFPKHSEERKQARECFQTKSYLLQNFDSIWAKEGDGLSMRLARQALDASREGNAKPYEGRLDWEADSELGSDRDDES